MDLTKDNQPDSTYFWGTNVKFAGENPYAVIRHKEVMFNLVGPTQLLFTFVPGRLRGLLRLNSQRIHRILTIRELSANLGQTHDLARCCFDHVAGTIRGKIQ